MCTSVLYLTEAEMSESLLVQMLESTDVDFPTLGKPPTLVGKPPSEGWNCPAASPLAGGWLETPALLAGIFHHQQDHHHHHHQPADSCQGAC